MQYLAICYTERLAAEGAVASVGSKGDSFDNALAESVIGLYKSELITLRGPWRTVDDVELATLAWVDWWNNRRLLWPIGGVPPREFEKPMGPERENRPPAPRGAPTSSPVVSLPPTIATLGALSPFCWNPITRASIRARAVHTSGCSTCGR